MKPPDREDLALLSDLCERYPEEFDPEGLSPQEKVAIIKAYGAYLSMRHQRGDDVRPADFGPMRAGVEDIKNDLQETMSDVVDVASSAGDRFKRSARARRFRRKK